MVGGEKLTLKLIHALGITITVNFVSFSSLYWTYPFRGSVFMINDGQSICTNPYRSFVTIDPKVWTVTDSSYLITFSFILYSFLSQSPFVQL